MKVILGITGASGVIYGIEVLRALSELGIEVHLILSKWAQETIKIETSYSVKEIEKMAFYSYDNNNLAAQPASGSFENDGMIISPCSMKTMAAIANGYTDNLVVRAADVTIKEKRKLVIVPRETPLSLIHLENMLKLAQLNTVIVPPMPAMYINPKSISDLVMHTVSRILDQIGVKNNISKRWEGLNLENKYGI